MKPTMNGQKNIVITDLKFSTCQFDTARSLANVPLTSLDNNALTSS
jgi:hypothetical protein